MQPTQQIHSLIRQKANLRLRKHQNISTFPARLFDGGEFRTKNKGKSP